MKRNTYSFNHSYKVHAHSVASQFNQIQLTHMTNTNIQHTEVQSAPRKMYMDVEISLMESIPSEPFRKVNDWLIPSVSQVLEKQNQRSMSMLFRPVYIIVIDQSGQGPLLT